jgi:ABC-type dipeptide/oligopeptide/nickel transport system ATPase component
MQKLTELVSLIKTPNTVVQIDAIRYTKGKSKIEAVRLASGTIWGMLNDNGSKIIQTDDNIAFWYDSEEHTVMEEGTELWNSKLNKDFGLNPLDGFSKLVQTEIRLRIVRDAPYTPVYYRAYWDALAKKLFVNLGGPEVYIIRGRNEIETSYNGECGILFVTHSNRKYVVPDFECKNCDIWDFLIKDLSFSKTTDAPATPEEQQELLKAWILAFFFPELMPTKPILSLIGQPGSGKTTAIRRILKILENPEADVLGIPTDKQDAFRSSIEKHRLLVIDNLEKSGAWWMVDMLNKLATGQHIEIRKLYKTNETHTIIPRCFVALTAVSVPFSDETLFSRLLILEMAKLDDPMPEHLIQRTIKENAAGIWADLLRKLSEVVEVLKHDRFVKSPSKSRLADFTIFCERIKLTPVVNGSVLSQGLMSMIDSQMKQLRESSQAVYLLDEWISLHPTEAAEWRNFADMYDILQNMAGVRRTNFPWKSAQALYRHFIAIHDSLRHEYQMELTTPQNGTFGPIKVRFNMEKMLVS